MHNNSSAPISAKPQLQELFQVALKYQKNSHSPYSKARIASAIRMSDGSIFGGCNIENASYGGTVCAERVAIWKAVSEGVPTPIQEVFVLSSSETAWPPCGLCLQVMAEFATAGTLVHVSNQSGEKIQSYKFNELLPASFTPDFLGE